jgi:hypothetical protein
MIKSLVSGQTSYATRLSYGSHYCPPLRTFGSQASTKRLLVERSYHYTVLSVAYTRLQHSKSLVDLTSSSIHAMASASTLPNLYQGVEKQSFGYKLLANLGWKEGQGLVRAICLATLLFILVALPLLLSAPSASSLEQASTLCTCRHCSYALIFAVCNHRNCRVPTSRASRST